MAGFGKDFWGTGGWGSDLESLFALATPVISGPKFIDLENDPVVDVEYTLSNLDTSVTGLVLGPNAVGVTIHDFVNNGDGTGTFEVDFSTGFNPWTIAIRVTNAASEISGEAVCIVYPLTAVDVGTEYSILPQQSAFTAVCDRLIDNMPRSTFILRRQYNVPWSVDGTNFELKVITPGVRTVITVVRTKSPGITDTPREIAIVPEFTTTTVKLSLGLGESRITARSDDGQTFNVVVNAANYATILCAYAREIHAGTLVDLEEQQAVIFSDLTTRLAERFLSFQDLMPDVQSLKILATKLAIRSLVSDTSKEAGVRDLGAALALNTPIFKAQDAELVEFEPTVRPLYRNAEAFGGVEAHLWFPNFCINRWSAFVRYVSNLSSVFTPIDVAEAQVLLLNEADVLERHVFPDAAIDDCSSIKAIAERGCFDDIGITVRLDSTVAITICAASYPLDCEITEGETFPPIEGEEQIDPTFDGGLGVCPADRYDSGEELDSMGAMPSPTAGIDDCAYANGYAVAPIVTEGLTMTVENTWTAAESNGIRSANLNVNITEP